ncbi:transposase, partial [Pseudomonas sp. RA_105y_Pfl1_P41]
AHHRQVVDLKEQIKLLRDRLFGRKSEQTVDPETPQLVLFNEAESVAVPIADNADEEAEEVVAPVKRRGKRKPLSADLPRIEVVH